jgi:hypothetical protein
MAACCFERNSLGLRGQDSSGSGLVQVEAIVNTVMNHRVLQNSGNCFIS